MDHCHSQLRKSSGKTTAAPVRRWADKTIGQKLELSEDRRRFVYAMIELLDANFD